MKLSVLILCFFVSFISHAEQSPFNKTRFAMGFYYPSLNNISSQTDIEISLNYWMKELTTKLAIEDSYAILFKNTSQMHRAFNAGKLDMIIAPPLILATRFDRALLTNGFMGVAKKDSFNNLLIIVRQELDINPINFIGKRLLLPSNDLLAKIFLETEVIKLHNRLIRSTFSHISERKRNQRIILDLFFGKADVALIYEDTLTLMTEMNPQIAKKISVIKSFPIKAGNYGYFHRDYQYKEQIKKSARTFSDQPRGRQILEVFRTTDVVPTSVSDLAQFDEYYQSYLRLKEGIVH